MPETDLRASTRSSLLWLGGASVFRDGLQFAATIALTRLLTPEIYGQASLGQTIIGFIAVVSFRSFVTFALQSRNPDSFDWKSHLRAGLMVNSGVFMLCNLLSAGLWLANGAHFQAVCIVLSVMSLSFLLEPFSTTRTTWLQAHHRWNRARMLEVCAGLSTALCGVLLALAGAGPLALAAMTPAQQLPALFDFLIFGRKLNPPEHAHQLSYHGAKSFAVTRLGSAFVQTVVALIEQSLLSGLFGFTALGLYNRAVGLVTMTSARIGPLVVQSIYPVLTRAEVGSDRYRKFAQILAQSILFLVIPATAFFAGEAAGIVHLLFGQKWNAVIGYVPLASIYVNFGALNLIVYSIMLANLQVGDCLKIDVGASVSRIAVALIAIPMGVIPFLLGLSIQATGVFVASVLVARRGGAITGWASFRSAAPAGIGAGLAVFATRLLPTFPGATAAVAGTLVLHGLVFAIVYVGAIRLIDRGVLIDILEYAPLSPALRAKLLELLFLKV